MTKAYQVAKPSVLGNFKKRGLAKKPKGNSAWRDERPGMSKAHLECIRQLPCCACMRLGSNEAHHLKATGARERGMGVKSTDRWALPLCTLHHAEIESRGSKNEIDWFLAHGFDPLELAAALWNGTGDVARMTRIFLAQKVVSQTTTSGE